MEKLAKLKKMEGFYFGGQMEDSIFSDMICRSHLRSVESQVDSDRKKGRVYQNLWQRSVIHNEELISTALPLMTDIYRMVEGTGFMVVLCDSEGLLLKTIGDEDTLKRARKICFVEGADWCEEAVGTNAIGTCIIEQVPLQVFHHEHFMKVCQEWTCSASPIFGVDGKLVGVLNVAGPYEKVHRHTLGMVVSTAKAVENLMNLQEKNRRNELMKSFLEVTMNSLSSGILLVNHQGEIYQANKTLLDMLKLIEEEIIDKKIHEVFENEIFLDNIMDIKDKDIRLKLKGNPHSRHVLLNSQPVFKGERQIASLLTFQEIQQVRQLVNHFTGNKANITFKEIIGRNPLFLKSIKEAREAAASPSNVLLLGESGTGKDLFAQAIHNESDRSNMPFIAINCGAIPKDLLGSELFGYAEGAFTGARKGGNSGKFELADGGTIFLDEIGEMSLDMQVLMLRVLQNREITRIGGHKVIPVNVRIIAATNKNLRDEVRKGHFREDLYFRLNVLPIQIPSLREREEDIALLASHFISRYTKKMPKKIESVSPSYTQAILNYNWPGNVRELQNVIERSLNRCSTGVLNLESLPEEIKGWDAEPRQAKSFQAKKDDIQKQELINVLRNCNYNYSKAAKELNISRSTLYRRLERFHLK